MSILEMRMNMSMTGLESFDSTVRKSNMAE